MRRLTDYLLLVVVIGVGAALWYTHPAAARTAVRYVENAIHPCATAMSYSIGSIDPRFGISRDIFLADLKDAEAIWEQPSGKNLFQYKKSSGDVTVNLIYDERQAATERLRAVGIEIDTSETTFSALKARYNSLTARVDAEQTSYESALAAYKEAERAYNSEVARWNERGGAPPEIYARLESEKAALANQLSHVHQLANEVNSDIDTANALATTLNKLIVQLNLNVDQYNQAGAVRGEFEEGLYEIQGGVQTIDIYEYQNHIQLVRVLAHEIGHAIGLEHVDDPKAIMFKINQGNNLVATNADLAELHRECSSGLF